MQQKQETRHQNRLRLSFHLCVRVFSISTPATFYRHSHLQLQALIMADQPGYIVASDSENPADDPPKSFPDVALGLDLGTSSCSLAAWRDSHVQLLPNPLGLSRFPSYVIFRPDAPSSGVTTLLSDSDLLSGSAIFHVKSFVGRIDTDPVVQTSKNYYPFLLQTMDIGVRPFLGALANDVWRSTTPEEVLAILLVELRAMAEAQLGRVIRSVVLTMPVSFSRFQQTRLERACAMAGLHVLRLMPEPTAVALLYAQQQQQAFQGNMGSGMERNALIFNMGTKHCDVAVTATAGGVSQIKALAGESIGGEDMVQNMIRYVLEEIHPSAEKELANLSKLAVHLRPIGEKAMHTLSSSPNALIEGDICGRRISRTITREEFEQVNAEIFQKCEALALQCLKEAQVDGDNLADLILVGGCSNIPRIRSLLQKVCGGKQVYQGIDTLEAAAMGAALEGAIASGFTDPTGKLDLLTIQAMPHSLGIRAVGNEFLPILQRNVTIPARRDVSVTTSHENQSEALIVVLEGEEKQANDNHLLGFFKLSGIPAAPKGVPIISVCMDVDASDVLRVVAGVCMPDIEKPVVPLIEVRMPTVDDGHGWCMDAISKKYGNLLEIDLLSRQSLPPNQ